ncbi:glycosyltransferase [Derxia gummosa]|uniref:Glycosyltransferase n=1 Tax=Derxia gummosa DSM 723 TaxID=1121388 RepID=A0A8B6XCX1_9BURK|nr:glycosyltransferase [Derxia gummosa]
MSEPLRLAIYLPNFDGGGVERMKLSLIDAFIKMGIDVVVAIHRREGELLHMLPEDVHVVPLEAARSIEALPKMIRFLRALKPHVLLSSMGHNNIIALWARALARSDAKVIISQHNALSRESVEMGNWQHRAMPGLYRRFGQWADGIIAVSEGVRIDMAEHTGIPLDRIDTIYNPVLDSAFHQRAAQPAHHPWLENPMLRVFVGAGRLVHQKDFPTLIRAFARVKAPEARLLILGDGPERRPLLQLIHDLGLKKRVQLAGFKHNPLPYIAAGEALVMSSIYEGYGNVLIEAMGCGTAVISTDCPYGPDEILDGGRYGQLVPVGDVGALAAAMERQLESPWPTAALRRRAQQQHVDTVARRYLELFARVSPKAREFLDDLPSAFDTRMPEPVAH